jgi:hypothetical protein
MRRTFATALVLISALIGTAQAQTDTGFVDATGVDGPRWHDTLFSTSATGTITATLGWTNGAANLDLFLFRKRSDGTWNNVAWSNSKTAQPETIDYENAPAGQYRLGVQAKTGESAFTLSYGTVASKPPDGDRPFVTLLFSRSAVTAADACVENDTGVARLDTVIAPELARRGMIGTGSVETGITQDTSLACIHGRTTLAASWSLLAHLRDAYGWRFVSHSSTYATNLGSLSPAEQYAETCGSLKVLEAHGHWSADGLFAYPDNKWSLQVQQDYVSKCYAFGRQFGSGPTSRTEATTSPYWQRTEGIPGGRCNNPALACSTLKTLVTYRSPDHIAAQLASLAPGQWLTLQTYLLVTGTRAGLWDCRSTDWYDHWTTDAERYCYSDYLRILDAIPSTAIVTDPKTVAKAWGRTNYTPPAP